MTQHATPYVADAALEALVAVADAAAEVAEEEEEEEDEGAAPKPALVAMVPALAGALQRAWYGLSDHTCHFLSHRVLHVCKSRNLSVATPLIIWILAQNMRVL